MGAGGSKGQVAPAPGGAGSVHDVPASAKLEALQKTADEKLIFDAHCHYTGYMQETEGVAALSKAM